MVIENVKKALTYSEDDFRKLEQSIFQLSDEIIDKIQIFRDFVETHATNFYESKPRKFEKNYSDVTTTESSDVSTSKKEFKKKETTEKQTFNFSNSKSVFSQGASKPSHATNGVVAKTITEQKEQETTPKADAPVIEKSNDKKLNIYPNFEYEPSKKEWLYLDPNGKIQGPFSSSLMIKWFNSKYLPLDLKIKSTKEVMYSLLNTQIETLGYLPFFDEVESKPNKKASSEKKKAVDKPKPLSPKKNEITKKIENLLVQTPSQPKQFKKTNKENYSEALPAKNLFEKDPKELLNEIKQAQKASGNENLMNSTNKKQWSKPNANMKVGLSLKEVLKLEEERSRKEAEMQLKKKKQIQNLSYAERMALKK